MPTLKYYDPVDGVWKPLFGAAYTDPNLHLESLWVQPPDDYADGGDPILVIRGGPGQFWKPFMDIRDDGGGSADRFARSVTSLYYDTLIISSDFWVGTAGANVQVRAGSSSRTALSVMRDMWSAAGTHVADFGTRDYGAQVDTTNAYVTQEGVLAGSDVQVGGASLPRGAASGSVGYAQITADSANTANSATIVDLAAPTIAFTAPAGRRYRITANLHMKSTVAGDRATTFIRNSASANIGVNTGAAIAAANLSQSVVMVAYDTPPAGAVSYKLSINRISGTGVITAGGGATQPCYLAVEDVGPA